jgi:membrane protein YfhO
VSRWLRWLWPYRALALLLGLVLWPAWTHLNWLIISADTLLIHYPYFVLWRNSLAAGELPFWNRYTLGGIPAFPTLQAGYGYPPHWLFSGVAAVPAMNWLIGLHVLLAGLGAAWCAGRLGASRSGQFLSGLAYALGSALVARMWAGHLSFLEGDAWLPWATGLALGLGMGRRGALIWLALVMALMILAGQPELLIMSAWWLPLWALGGAWISGVKRPARALPVLLFRTVLAIGLGVGLAAFQLLPTLQLLAISNRRAEMSWDFATTASLPPWHLLGVLAPLLFGDPLSNYWPGPAFNWHERLLYVGVVPLLAAVRASGRQRWLCLAAAAVAIGLSFGRYVPFYAWLQLLPGYADFKIPSKHLTLAALALALAAGLGLPRLRGRSVMLGALALAGLLASLALTLDQWGPVAASSLPGSDPARLAKVGGAGPAAGGVPLALGLLIGVAILTRLPLFWSRGGLLLLAVFDLVFTLQPWRFRVVDPSGPIANAGALREYRRAAVVDRDSAMLGNFGPVLRVVQPSGYVSLFSAEYMVLLLGHADAVSAIGLTRADDPALRLLGYPVVVDLRQSVAQTFDPVPPLVWVAHCSWPGGALAVRAPEFPRESCITRRGTTEPDPTVAPSPARLVRDGNGWLEAEAEGPGWLVTVQPWYPGWSGMVDGAPATVEAADGALVGVALGPGLHQIRLSYRPAGLDLGLWITALSGLLLLGSWYLDRARSGRPAPGAPG